jgi:hypothetical protein
MRPSLILMLVAAAACSRSEPVADSVAATPAAATPAMLTSADVGGTWDAQGMPMEKDTVVVTFTMNNTDTGDGTWITFPSGLKVQNTSRQVNGDSMVSETGGFKSQVRSGRNVASTRTVLRMMDGKLVGTTHSKYSNGDTATFRITATKRAQP